MSVKYHLAWPTHNRPESVAASVKSLANLDPSLYSITISNSGDKLLNGGVKGTVFEGESRAEWIENFIKKTNAHGVPSHLVRFALSPDLPNEVKAVTTGSNRNFLLLQLVGKKFFSFDDDVLLEPKKIKLPENSTLMRSSKQNPFNMKFLSSLEELQKVIKGSESIDLLEVLDSQLRLLERNHGITMSGLYGDSGFRSPRMIFGFDEESLTSLLQSPTDYQTAVTSRFLCRFSSEVLSLKASPFLPPCSGFANDQDLPPFFPIGRNEDGAYVYTLLGVLDLKIGIVPFAINHIPREDRSYSGTMNDARSGINDILCLLWMNFIQSHKGHGYKESSDYFKRVGGLSSVDFTNFLNKLVTNNFEGKLQRLDEKIKNLSSKNLPAFSSWHEGAMIERENYKKVIENPHKSSPLEFSTLNFKDSLELTRELLSRYGELLGHWTMLRKIAEGLSA